MMKIMSILSVALLLCSAAFSDECRDQVETVSELQCSEITGEGLPSSCLDALKPAKADTSKRDAS